MLLGVFIGAPIFLVVSIVCGVRAAWRRELRALWPAAALALVGLAGLAVFQLNSLDSYEWNPSIGPGYFEGVWRNGRSRIAFHADGTFVASDGVRSRWNRDGDWEAAAGPTKWRALRRDNDDFVIRVDDNPDPDGWSRSDLFHRERE